MAMGGEALWAMPVMWVLTVLVFFFLLLRLYTRIVCLAAYGVDDHIYAVAFIFLLIYTSFIQVSANYGFGQTPAEIGDPEKIVKATLYECIGQGFAIIGMAIAKAALGTFLLRLVSVTWHRIVLWVAMIAVSIASVAQVFCFWLSCRPFEYVYDRRIEGSCPVDTRPTSYILCVSTVLVDLFFAIFPWIVVWDLQMPRREKLTIAGSFSLGVIAAAAGIKRTTEVEGLYTPDYLRDSVGLIVWSNAEMSITLICIGIPVCRPLYKRVFNMISSSSRSVGYQKQDPSSDNTSGVVLRTIGGGAVNRDGQFVHSVRGNKPQGESESETSLNELKLGIHGPFTQTRVDGGRSDVERDDNSMEAILEHDKTNYQDEIGNARSSGRGSGIKITETIRIERYPGRPMPKSRNGPGSMYDC